MFCSNCGTHLQDDSIFCSICGTKVREEHQSIQTNELAQTYADSSDVGLQGGQTTIYITKKSSWLTKSIIIIIVIIAVLGALTSIIDTSDSVNNKSNSYVEFVKTGSPNDYPGVTYDQAFNDFFTDPTWKYFESDEGQDIVEFTGQCTYQDVAVTVTMQFKLTIDEGTFEVVYFDMNGVPQNILYLYGIISAAFDNYIETH